MGRREEEARRLDATKRHEENVGRLREEKRLRDLEKQVGTACWKGHKANALRKKLFNEMDRNRDVSLLVYGTVPPSTPTAHCTRYIGNPTPCVTTMVHDMFVHAGSAGYKRVYSL